MPLIRDYFTDERGITYERTEDESSIEWRIVNGRLKSTYHKHKEIWYSHHDKVPTIRYERSGCKLEINFQKQQRPAQPEYRLVSRGQSLKTGKEIIELHVHVLPRGRWEKMPLEVKIVPELNWTLVELEDWIKESWGTH